FVPMHDMPGGTLRDRTPTCVLTKVNTVSITFVRLLSSKTRFLEETGFLVKHRTHRHYGHLVFWKFI
ncbi:hypothetical protein, partial [Aerosakkonema funiforme]|uniref:hypothetical protein n=1 Tax=Aerosakkonema funiforme TaxID=1246630 RepID=UPI001A7EB4EA